MKIAHLSDLHYASETLEEVDRCMDAAIAHLAKMPPAVIVISGDATDYGLAASSSAYRALAKRVHQLSDIAPVLFLQGTFSHEPKGTLDVFRLVYGKYPVHVADRLSQVAWTGVRWVESAGWRFEDDEVAGFDPLATEVIFSCVPTLNKAVLAASIGATDAATALGENLLAVLQGYGAVNSALRIQGVPTVLVSHGTVSGCVTEHDVPMSGMDHEYTTGSLFAAKSDAVMLGHIHKHQSWERDGCKIAYAGSLACLHYGEHHDKGFLVWDVVPVTTGQSVSFDFVKSPTAKRLHLEFDGPPIMEDLANIAVDAQAAYVRIRYIVDEEHAGGVDKDAIKAMLAMAKEIKLEGQVLPVVRTRCEGMAAAPTVADKLKRWCVSTGVDSSGLMERLALLQSQSPEEIAGVAS